MVTEMNDFRDEALIALATISTISIAISIAI